MELGYEIPSILRDVVDTVLTVITPKAGRLMRAKK